jgi:hypothetical protein
VRDLTITNLEYSPAWIITGRGYKCKAGCMCGGMPDNLVPRTVRFDPKLRILGNCLVGASYLLGHRSVCLGLPCNVINQSIVVLSPLSETV